MAIGLQRSGDWLAARCSDQCAALLANHRYAVGLLPLLREEFRLLKFILHSGIFAIKVEGCQKSRGILDVFFALPNFRGQAFQNLYTFYHH